jgi:hypothetical protein
MRCVRSDLEIVDKTWVNNTSEHGLVTVTRQRLGTSLQLAVVPFILMTAGQHHGTQRHHHPSKASFLSPGDQEEDEAPLLYDEQDEQAREHAYRAPFPWFQFSILFALQTAIYLPYNVTRPFTPDVRSSLLF